jgi:hypothetical protein
LQASRWNTASSFNGLYDFFHGNGNLGYSALLCGGILFIRSGDDGVNRTFEVSCDGINWILVTYYTRTDFMTPNQMGFFFDCQSTAFPTQGVTLIHWKVY